MNTTEQELHDDQQLTGVSCIVKGSRAKMLQNARKDLIDALAQLGDEICHIDKELAIIQSQELEHILITAEEEATS
jgi:hypothetical protein